MRLALLSVAMSCTPVVAQQTWIVAAGGGGHFTDLPAAEAAAAPGDTLLIRPGVYSSTTVTKALQLVGDGPGVLVRSQLRIGPLTPSGQVVVTRIEADAFYIDAPTSLESCPVWQATASNHPVTFMDCAFRGGFSTLPALTIASGDVVLSGCNAAGTESQASVTRCCCYLIPGAAAIEVLGGTLTIADSTITGMDARRTFCPYFPLYGIATAAIVNTGGTVHVTRSALTGGLDVTNVRVPAVVGTVLTDPSTTITPTTGTGTGTLFLPATGGQGAAPGGTMSCVAESLPNHPVALAASLGLRGPTAVPFGIAWVDPATFVVLRIGITDGSGRMTTTIAIPPGIPRGLPLTVQTAAGSPTNQTLVLGVPAVLHVL